MYTKFQVDWTSTSSKTTLTKNFNLKRDKRTTGGRTDEHTDGRTHRLENTMSINGAYKFIVERENIDLAKMKVR